MHSRAITDAPSGASCSRSRWAQFRSNTPIGKTVCQALPERDADSTTKNQVNSADSQQAVKIPQSVDSSA